MNFDLINFHRWTLADIEAMTPFERDIYVSLLNEWIEDENQRKARGEK